LSLEKQEGEFNETRKRQTRLILPTEQKDRYNRDKGVNGLEKSYYSGNITKENINKRGYNNFLTFQTMLKLKLTGIG